MFILARTIQLIGAIIAAPGILVMRFGDALENFRGYIPMSLGRK